MQDAIKEKLTQASEKWNSLDKKIRIKVILLAIAVVLAIGVTVFLTSRPKWVVLENNSEINTIGQIQNILDDAGISNEIIKNGTGIQVQEADIDKAKILLAQNNVSIAGFTFDDAIKQANVGMSEKDKTEMYLQAKQTELARHIETLDGIEKASVKLAIPEDTVIFKENKPEPSASITVVASKEISKEQAMVMARLVCMSVEGLDMKNIVILDQNANSIYSDSSDGAGGYFSKEDVEKAKKQEIENKIRAALVKKFDDVNIILNIKFDWDKKQQKTTTYKPPVDDMTVGVPQKQVKETESIVNGTNGLEPGVEENDMNPTNYAMEEESNATYDKNVDDSDYLYNTVEQIVDTDGGSVIYDESSISVVVYDIKEYKEEELIKNGTITTENTWEQFKEDNQSQVKIEIDEDLIDNLRIGTGIENLSVVGYTTPVFIDYDRAVAGKISIEQIIVLVILALLLILLAFALIKKTEPENIEEIEPELEVSKLILSTEEEEQKEENKIEEIEEVESEYMKQINKFVDEKPEAVVSLLRNWLNEDWE